MSAWAWTQLSPNAIAVSNKALPRVVPATVVSAARTPRVAPVEMTRVTIGPGAMIRTIVIRRKAVKSSIFMSRRSVRIPLPLGSAPEQSNGQRDPHADDGECQQILVHARLRCSPWGSFFRQTRAAANQRPEGASACSAHFVNGQPLLAAVR